MSLNKKVTKEVSLRGANVALPRARCALLRISRSVIMKLPNNTPLCISALLTRRRGILKGAHLLEAPLKSASFGSFLAETRKEHIHTHCYICFPKTLILGGYAMGTRITDLHCKEVICVADGRRLGFVTDVEFNPADGCITALIVPGPCRFLGVAGRREDYVIPWGCIKRIGPDIILVDARPDDCCRPRQKLFFGN